MNSVRNDSLAIRGGSPVRTAPWPKRRPIDNAERDAVMRLFDEAIEAGGGLGYGGPAEIAYREAFSTFQGGGFTHTVSSGTAAVYVALRALELKPGEIIVPPTTDPGGVMPVALVNCTPVAADAAPDSLNANAETIAARLTDKTRAILLVHWSGTPVDMDPIIELARKAGLPVIEDCAQAHGAIYKGAKVGTFGDIAAFSTMYTKHHATGGTGGLVFTRDPVLAKRLPLYGDRGKPPIEEVDWRETDSCRRVATLNFNLGDLPATIGRVQLKKLPGFLERRRSWMARLAEACEATRCFRVATWGMPIENCSFWFALLRVDVDALGIDAVRLGEIFEVEGIPLGAENLEIANRSPWYAERKVFGDGSTPDAAPWTTPQPPNVPNADAACTTHLSFDVNEQLGQQEVEDIVTALKKVESTLLN